MRINIKNLPPRPIQNRHIQGYYRPVHEKKYIGDLNKIIYRSSWERVFCVFCDSSEKIIKWSSEPFPIKYISPIDKKEHEYNVDFYIKVEQNNGNVEEYLVEVKPKHQLMRPKQPKNQTIKNIKRYNSEVKTFLINRNKFSAAKTYAAKVGYKFLVVTEDFLFNHGKSETDV